MYCLIYDPRFLFLLDFLCRINFYPYSLILLPTFEAVSVEKFKKLTISTTKIPVPERRLSEYFGFVISFIQMRIEELNYFSVYSVNDGHLKQYEKVNNDYIIS